MYKVNRQDKTTKHPSFGLLLGHPGSCGLRPCWRFLGVCNPQQYHPGKNRNPPRSRVFPRPAINPTQSHPPPGYFPGSTPRSDIPVFARNFLFSGFWFPVPIPVSPWGTFSGNGRKGEQRGFCSRTGFFHLFLGFGRPGTKPTSRADFNPGSESRFRTPVRTRIGPIRVLVPPSPETRKSRKPGGGSVKTIYSRSRPAEREKAGGIEIPLKFTHPKAGPF